MRRFHKSNRGRVEGTSLTTKIILYFAIAVFATGASFALFQLFYIAVVMKGSIQESLLEDKIDEPTKYLPCEPGVIYRRPGMKPFQRRADIGRLLEEKRYKTGAEVGVQRGINANSILSQWTSCEHFKLIDLWSKQENYTDVANVDQATQDENYRASMDILKPFDNITKFYRMSSTEAAMIIDNFTLDFVYIDARHDYCGVSEDIKSYWPKLRPGGIMAGHDYLYASEVRGQDWSLCANGQKHPGAVRGAVEEFALEHGLVVSVEYGVRHQWKSWAVQKPTRKECL